MSTQKLSNISLNEFRAFLELCHCKNIRDRGGHEIWSRSDLRRPVVIQSHINPIPEFIVKNILKTLGYTKKDYFSIINSDKEVVKNGKRYDLK